MHAFSGRFSRTCLEGISFNFFVCFIFNVSLGSAPKRKNFDIQRNTRVGSGGQFTSNRLSNDLTQNPKIIFYHIFACVRAEEEKLKLMLQLDEVQLRLKSVEFRKPVTKRIQHKGHDTS